VHRTLLRVALLVFLLGEVLGAFGVSDYAHTGARYFINPGNPFFASAGLGAYLLYLRTKPGKRELALSFVLGLLAEGLLRHWRTQTAGAPLSRDWLTIAQTIGCGLGASGLVLSLGRALWGNRAGHNKPALEAVYEQALIPVFVLLSGFFLHFTLVLHPGVLDPLVFAAELGLGADTGFNFARAVASNVPLTWVLIIIYVELPLAIAFVYAAEKARKIRLRSVGSADPDQGDDVLTSFVAVGFFGFLCYHLCPVIGPRFFFDTWPKPVDVAQIKFAEAFGAANELRNCVPSLHTSWALMLFWHARPQNVIVRNFGAAFLVLTLMATVGLGWHYLIDLVVAFPFSLMIRSAFRTKVAWSHPFKNQAFLFGAGCTLLWLVLIRVGAPMFHAAPAVSFLFSALSVFGALFLEERLLAAPAMDSVRDEHGADTNPLRDEGPPSASPPPAPPAGQGIVLPLLAAFTFSGFAGLVYEVVFAKELALTFGSTSKASTTVLATYMGGLALGSYLGAKVARRAKLSPLVLYALCEAGVALACAVSPWLFHGVRSLYVSIAAGTDPGAGILTVLQLALGALALLPPTILMGMTMPALAVFLDGHRNPSADNERDEGRAGLGESVGLLYGANTLGAGFGALLAGYVLMPAYHVRGTTWIATGLNLLAAAIAYGLSRYVGKAAQARVPSDTPEDSAPGDPRLLQTALVLLGGGGVITLALETTYIHMLAIVAGNSVYAFSLMLFAFLLGLGGGSKLGRLWLAHGDLRTALVWSQGLIALAVLVCAFAWNQIPLYFSGFYGFEYASSFAVREFIRFLVCAAIMFPVALAIGAAYPLTMEALSQGAPRDRLLWMGRGMAVNTCGNIVGALLGTFVLLPALESMRSIVALAAASLALAVFALSHLTTGLTALRWQQHGRTALPLLLPALLLPMVPPLNLSVLSTGANVYFHMQPWGTVFDHAESADGGLTAVARSMRGARSVKTLLTNGKFQGDDDPDGEMRAQLGFAVVPLVHTQNRNHALVIGLGTGVSARTVRNAGFANIEVAELSADVARLASKHFGPINENVLQAPNVKTLITDGRNHLMLSKTPYDLVTIELSSIWFAGAASLYNREFYQLVDQRLSPNGILQQWIQLHRISHRDMAYVLGSVRSVFPSAWLYFVGNQGIVIACRHDCAPTMPAIQTVNRTPELAQALRFFDGRAENILPMRVLDTVSMDRFLASEDTELAPGERPISTDDNLVLEYSTPKGNVRPYRESIDENVATLRQFEPDSPLTSTYIKPGEVHFDEREKE
jgi:predicted membrane-bound spermidine synthase